MSLTALLASWELALESDNKSPKTIRSYIASERSLAAFLRANDMPADVEDVTTESIRAFPVRERTTPPFAQQHYRDLSVFWRGLARSCRSGFLLATVPPWIAKRWSRATASLAIGSAALLNLITEGPHSPVEDLVKLVATGSLMVIFVVAFVVQQRCARLRTRTTGPPLL
jgi:hypothetical protein